MARSGHNFVLQNVLSWLEDGEHYIHHNLENIDPHRLTINHLKHPGFKLLIWRDFDDWLASSIAKAYKIGATRTISDIPKYIDRICKTYWAIYQEGQQEVLYKPRIVIHYDEFYESRKYRQGICDKVKGEYSEKLIDYVPANGRFSSFDGRDYQGNGSKMNVLNRADDILKTEHKELFLKTMERYGNRFRI